MAGGKYLQQKPPRGGRNSGNNTIQDNYERQNDNRGGGKKVLLIVMIVVLVLIIALAIGGIIYYNSVLNMMSRPDDITVPTLSEEELAELRGTVPAEMPTPPTEIETTSPEDTWPEVVSDKNITNIMVVGQAARAGEEHRLADSNILVTINREQKTITLTSIQRDLRVNIPAYENHGAGFNRINVVYHLGSYYTGKIEDSMNMITLCMEQNFGIKVDHVVEIDFDIFKEVVELLGGVTVEINKEQLDYLRHNHKSWQVITEPGTYTLNGPQALGYVRMRKVGNGDWDRTERQRDVVTQLLGKLKKMGIMEIKGLFEQILPRIVTNMTNEEITNLAFEMIPMLSGLEIQSFRIPADGTWWSTDLDPDGVHNYVIDANLQKNGELLREMIGYVKEES